MSLHRFLDSSSMFPRIATKTIKALPKPKPTLPSLPKPQQSQTPKQEHVCSWPTKQQIIDFYFDATKK